MTEKELDKIVNSMTEEQLKGYAKIGLMYSLRLIKILLEKYSK